MSLRTSPFVFPLSLMLSSFLVGFALASLPALYFLIAALFLVFVGAIGVGGFLTGRSTR